jgi:dienelactone hydrolase
MRIIALSTCLLIFLVQSSHVKGQKKPLDHTVYDGWQTIGEKLINANGEWIAYTIDVQEGDGQLVIQKSDSSFSTTVPRGYNIRFTADGNHLIGKIKPLYFEQRAAKIKKIKPEDFPQDSLFVFNIADKHIEKIAGVKSYSIPEKSSDWLAFSSFKKTVQLQKPVKQLDTAVSKKDSGKISIPQIIEHKPDRKQKRKLSASEEREDDLLDESPEDAEGDEPAAGNGQEGTELVIKSLKGNGGQNLPLISEYKWSENGKILLLKSSISKVDKSIQPAVFIWRSAEKRFDTLLKGGNDFKNFVITEDASQIAFLAERDSAFKSAQKFYKLWHWQNGDLGASILADKFSIGMPINWTISENSTPVFSKSGKRVFIGIHPIKPLKDTTLVEMDMVKLDIWHYKDDYLQPYQLKRFNQERNLSYLSMIQVSEKKIIPLADPEMPQVVLSNTGDTDFFLGISDVGKRIPMQWEGSTKRDVYQINPADGSRKLIIRDLSGFPQLSPGGNFIYWYDNSVKHYFSYDSGSIVNISKKITQKLYDEDYDMPSDPTPYGIMRWHEKDSFVYVYDRFDIWKLDPKGKVLPELLTRGMGRKNHVRYRYISKESEEQFVKSNQPILLKTFNEKNKYAGFASMELCCGSKIKLLQEGPYAIGQLLKAKDSEAYLFISESFKQSPNVFVSSNLSAARQISSINPQQEDYNWMTAELFSWKAYDGKVATGIVYKPADYQAGKKYPMIAYFYETLSDGLYNYLPPAPTPSRLNIPFFVSRGYIVLAPDIRYAKGFPGKAAYDYVVSGARALVKKGWVDSTKMGIQGQSWGGYQVAHIITRTPVFAAAWAGAPVANMTSAYGGIRWESGMNRQFQYEKSQSRIGATLWEKPNLYIENSPLFYLPKVKTPLVIMANDNDGAVPWYQGIELFTAMRRLGKQVWMLNYNGEAHNLVERKNRKDIQIREQQFFDWLLKGEKPTVWLTDGVPAIDKGRAWGLERRLE